MEDLTGKDLQGRHDGVTWSAPRMKAYGEMVRVV